MADHFYSWLKGDGLSSSNITAGTSTSGEAVELRTRDGQGLTKQDVKQALVALEGYLATHDVTP